MKKIVGWQPVKGIDLRPGMTLCREPVDSKSSLDTLRLAEFTGSCAKGLHFGSGCYDRISTWWRPIVVTVKSPADLMNSGQTA